MDIFQSLFVDTWPGWVGGAVISAVVITLLLARNRSLGVSSCYAFAIDRVHDWFESRARKAVPSPAASFPMPGESGLENPADFPHPADFPMPGAFPLPSASSTTKIQDESYWQPVFLGGILLGGVVSGIMARLVLGTNWAPNFDYAGFDSIWKVSPWAKTAVLFAGGMLVGFGTRMGGGCTSGHAITGAPGLQKASIIAMCVFMGVGVAVTFLLNALL
jgi:uncharacterized protein